MEKIIITNQEAGQRLDMFLSNYLKQSRSQVQKLIVAGKVQVGDRVLSKHYALKEGETLILAQKRVTKRKTKPQALLVQLQVVAETPDYLILNKPAGLIVHPAVGIKTYTLVDWLLANYPEVARVGDDLLRPGIVHRLDKEVSGLIVVARNQNSFDSLKQQFKLSTVSKRYQALVHGVVNKDSDTIEFTIARSPSGKMAARPEHDDGRKSLTEFEVIKKFLHFTLLLVTIKTGRTHQIRVHLAAYNHPVVGDKLYGTKISKVVNIKLGLDRLFLVASKLEFTDLQGQRQQFALDLPNDLQELLTTLK